ncbi:uncharacterized protein [Amphiura filiformis]|uniref:uncharacterized protein n=1 Tax=Amphiura filiformis TaxID=82378 RepID=UPI003B2269E4
MTEMGDAGFVTGVVFGAATALAFLLACLYSAYKAIVDRRRIIRKNDNIRSQRLEEAADMVGEVEAQPLVDQNQHTAANGTAGASTSPTGATSATSLHTPALEERRPSAAFKPPPPPPEKQWEQQGVHYRSEGGIMHIHKSDSSKLSVGPGDETEKEPLMSAPDFDAGLSSDDKAEEVATQSAEETETAPEQKSETPTDETPEEPVASAAAAATTTTATTTTSETTTMESSETTAQVHVTVSISEHQDGQVITSTSTEAFKQLDSSTTTESAATGSTKVHNLFTSTSGDGTRTETATDLPDVTNGDPAAWV